MNRLKLTNLPNFGKSTQNHNFSKIIKIPNFNLIFIGFNKNQLSQFLGGVPFQKTCTIPGKSWVRPLHVFNEIMGHRLC